MEELTIDQRAKKEQTKLKSVLNSYKVNKQKMKVLMPIIENVAWMKVKLEDARDLIRDADIVVEYDNGGGQRGIRENTLVKGYESLWKSYISGMNQIMDVLPEEKAKEAEEIICQLKGKKYLIVGGLPDLTEDVGRTPLGREDVPVQQLVTRPVLPPQPVHIGLAAERDGQPRVDTAEALALHRPRGRCRAGPLRGGLGVPEAGRPDRAEHIEE